MQVFPTKQYKKSLKKVLHGGKIKVTEVDLVVDFLCKGNKIPQKYNDHALTGEYFGYRELHIRPNVLLIYKIDNQILVLILVDIGSHSELFD